MRHLLTHFVPYQLPEAAQQRSSNNRKQTQPLWINYMLSLNPLIGCGQPPARTSCWLRAKAKQYVYALAFLNTHLPVSTHDAQTSRPGMTVANSDHTELLRSLHDWDVEGALCFPTSCFYFSGSTCHQQS